MRSERTQPLFGFICFVVCALCIQQASAKFFLHTALVTEGFQAGVANFAPIEVVSGLNSLAFNGSDLIYDAEAIISLTAGTNYTLSIINPNVSQRCDGLPAVKLNLTVNATVNRDYYFCNLSISLFYLRVIKLEQLTEPLPDCPTNQVRDCYGNCASLSYKGNGDCDNGSLGPNFNCSAFDYDDGDCFLPPQNCNYDEIRDCLGYCRPKEWLGDGFCDNGLFGEAYFNCTKYSNDNQDCDFDYCKDVWFYLEPFPSTIRHCFNQITLYSSHKNTTLDAVAQIASMSIDPPTAAINNEMERMRNFNYTADWEFQLDVANLFHSYQTCDAAYDAPIPYHFFYTIRPFSHEIHGSDGFPQVLIALDTKGLYSYYKDFFQIDLSAYVGETVISINGIDAATYIAEHTYVPCGGKSAAINYAASDPLLFEVMDWRQTPEVNYETYEFLSKGTLNVTMFSFKIGDNSPNHQEDFRIMIENATWVPQPDRNRTKKSIRPEFQSDPFTSDDLHEAKHTVVDNIVQYFTDMYEFRASYSSSKKAVPVSLTTEAESPSGDVKVWSLLDKVIIIDFGSWSEFTDYQGVFSTVSKSFSVANTKNINTLIIDLINTDFGGSSSCFQLYMLHKFFPQITELRNLTEVDVRKSTLLSQLVAQGIEFFPVMDTTFGSKTFSQFYNAGSVPRTEDGVNSDYTPKWHMDCSSEWQFYDQFNSVSDLPAFNRVAVVANHFSPGIFLSQVKEIPYLDLLFFGGSSTDEPVFMWSLDDENRITWSSLVEAANTESQILTELVTTADFHFQIGEMYSDGKLLISQNTSDYIEAVMPWSEFWIFGFELQIYMTTATKLGITFETSTTTQSATTGAVTAFSFPSGLVRTTTGSSTGNPFTGLVTTTSTTAEALDPVVGIINNATQFGPCSLIYLFMATFLFSLF